MAILSAAVALDAWAGNRPSGTAARKVSGRLGRTSRPPSFRPLKRRVRRLERRLVNALYRDDDLVEALLVKDGIYIDHRNKGSLLESPVCLAASLQLKGYLEHDPILRRARAWVTDKGVGDSGFRHITLLVDNYFGPGRPLRIDPTFRQFFPEVRGSPNARKRYRFVPKIFVGSDEDAARLFKCVKPAATLEKNRWIETYLDGRPVAQ